MPLVSIIPDSFQLLQTTKPKIKLKNSNLRKMNQEFNRLLKAWISAVISISYSYYIPTKIKPGFLRFLSILPVCVHFLILPLFFSSTVHYSFTLSFFLSGLATSKLISFAFNKGPLLPLPSNLTQFVCLTIFPIKLQQNPKPQIHPFFKYLFPIKFAIFSVLLLYVYNYRQYLPQIVILALYSLHIYLELEIFLQIIKFLVSFSLNCDLEPQFNEPYLSSSLYDFWGHRWNLMVSNILKLGVYVPVRRLQVKKRQKSSEMDLFLGFVATFLVSGLVHELVFFYVTREKPTWEVTFFFVLHGVCTGIEVTVKRTRRFPMINRVVSRLLTVGFVFLTGCWLFYPQLMRSKTMERLVNEALLFTDFVNQELFVSI